MVSSDKFAPALPRLRILAAHDCHFVPVTNSPPADLVVARVAGYDTAIYGLPEKDVFPILFELPERNLIVATTRLSSFVTGRYAPADDWLLVWETHPRPPSTRNTRTRSRCPRSSPQPTAPRAKLPRRFERQAFAQAAGMVRQLAPAGPSLEKAKLYQALAANEETTAPAPPDAPGRRRLPRHPRRLRLGNPLRRQPAPPPPAARRLQPRIRHGPCPGSASSTATSTAPSSPATCWTSSYFNSGMCQGVRGRPAASRLRPHGLGRHRAAWLVANYGDDNARAMLATAVAAAA